MNTFKGLSFIFGGIISLFLAVIVPIVVFANSNNGTSVPLFLAFPFILIALGLFKKAGCFFGRETQIPVDKNDPDLTECAWCHGFVDKTDGKLQNGTMIGTKVFICNSCRKKRFKIYMGLLAGLLLFIFCITLLVIFNQK